MHLIFIYFCTENEALFKQAKTTLLQANITITWIKEKEEFLESQKNKTKAIYIVDDALSFIDNVLLVREKNFTKNNIIWLINNQYFPSGFKENDDFIVLPLRKKDLLLRINFVLKERFASEKKQFFLDCNAYQLSRYPDEITCCKKTILLTKKEFDIAYLMFKHEGVPLSRYTLEETFWKDQDVSSRTIDTHISRIKQKLKLDGTFGYAIELLYGYGYRLVKCEKTNNGI